MKNIRILLLILVLSCNTKNEAILPQKVDITESVYSSVTVQPDSLYQAYATVGGLLDKNLVDEGDAVTKGQPIVQVINNTPQLNTQNAKLSLQLARQNYRGNAAVLKGIEDEIEAAMLQFRNDSINYFRQKNLWEQNIGAKATYDAKKLNYELSQKNLQQLKSRYNRTKNELRTAVEQAENSYQASLINTGDFTIESKINGKVYALYKNPGEIVNTMEPVATVGSSDAFVIEMLVDEVDIVKVSEGHKVLITLDAYKNKVLTGKVSKIYPKKDERNQTFMVEAVFDDAPEVLYPGLSGEANIVIAQKENVLTIPKSYLIEDNKVRTENGITEITVGIESIDKVEVVAGIDENTKIYKPEE